MSARAVASALLRVAARSSRTLWLDALSTVALQATSSSTPGLTSQLIPQPLPFAATALNQVCHKSFSSSSSSSSSDEEEWEEFYDSYPIAYPPSQAFIGNPAPYFKTMAVVDGEMKEVKLSDYKGKFVLLFFYPKDFTFVCPTEIIAFSDRAKEFEALNCQVLACSTDTEEVHLAWCRTPRNKGGLGYMQIPILADTTKSISARYGVLIPDKGIALRGLFIINPEGNIEQITINPLPVGRSVDEALRLLEAIQFVREHGEVCPANWKPGQQSMVADPDKSLDYFSTVHAKESEESFASQATPINSRKDFDEAIKSGKPTVVDFYAPWCGKCRQIGPFVDQLVQQHPDVQFVKVDTTAEAVESIGTELGVKALPAFRFFKNGKEVVQEVAGYKKKLLEDSVKQLKDQK